MEFRQFLMKRAVNKTVLISTRTYVYFARIIERLQLSMAGIFDSNCCQNGILLQMQAI